MKRDTLIYWRDVPMDVDMGSFEYIANHWGQKIIVVSMRDFPEERKICGWTEQHCSNVETVILSNMESADETAYKIIRENPDAIHIFNGIRGYKQKYLDDYIKKRKNPKIAVIAERPSLYGSIPVLFIKNILFAGLYGGLRLKYHKKIACFLAMGKSGVSTYSKYGWSKKILYPYMYNPKLPEVSQCRGEDNKIKFLYIGRFDAQAKGVDILMKAVDSIGALPGWELDLVGGYGHMRDAVIAWCSQKDNVNYKGIWENHMVCSNMAQYDICIVPSRYDGWNLTPNQAIKAGIATIITDRAGSDELISYSKAGMVIKAGSSKALSKALTLAVTDGKIVMEWKQNAKAYQKKISSETVGQYFIDIMDYHFYRRQRVRPMCPWETR